MPMLVRMWLQHYVPGSHHPEKSKTWHNAGIILRLLFYQISEARVFFKIEETGHFRYLD